MYQRTVQEFDEWREIARILLRHHIKPELVQWNGAAQSGLFDEALPQHHLRNAPITVPRSFLSLAQNVAYHRDEQKWALLYRILWRLNHDEPHLLRVFVDDDVALLQRMVKEVSRDAHKMKAFVRFRAVEGEENSYVAWHEPSHLVVRKTAPFFARRFAAMRWAILTPDESVAWDGEALHFGQGVSRDHAPDADEMEELWKTFYRHIFNPARIKIAMMKSEMPVKYWHTMPETALIPSMLEEADARVQAMLDAMPDDSS